jgi:membrane dipeptidase
MRSIGIAIMAASILVTAAPAVAERLNEEAYLQAIEILESVPLIDGHNDVPWQYRARAGNRLDAIDLAADTSGLEPPMHTDIPRLRQGRVGGQFWSVYVAPAIVGPAAVKAQLEQIDLARRMIERYDDLQFATTADEVEAAFSAGRIASLLGMEGGHVLDNSLATLRIFHAAGARYLTLTHSRTHDWADSATDTPRHEGLTEFGREVVREMNRLGMLVDLSHVHPRTMHDALDASVAPVIFSHSSAMGVTEHARNVPDDVLDRVPRNGGIVMVTFVPYFVSSAVRDHRAARRGERERLLELYPGDPERVASGLAAWLAENPAPSARLTDVADHIDYIRARIGAAHIGIGGDYDGITELPEGLEDVSTYPALFAELIRRGYSRDELEQIAGRNALRVMRAAEAVALRLQQERKAADTKVEDVATKKPAP